MERETNYTGKKTSPLMIAAAWAVVSIPLLYGIYFTTIKAIDLFK